MKNTHSEKFGRKKLSTPKTVDSENRLDIMNV